MQVNTIDIALTCMYNKMADIISHHIHHIKIIVFIKSFVIVNGYLYKHLCLVE